MDKRTIKPTCNFPYCKKSKLRYYNILNESERLSCISEHFWKATETLRNFSFIYNLKSNFDSYVVCKTMFLNTLGINELMLEVKVIT
ncbi:Uncharacterized protein FWK35_00023519 [Aphis craccivora]|uniref:Uncharacterized protein n=1 Tax=Aphis craccivora TaxID=307492 RepID=A0A6G0Y6Q1_APHCR|nr:Uncharacterized protein FWK35_00023519 [Aphis craccivora]